MNTIKEFIYINYKATIFYALNNAELTRDCKDRNTKRIAQNAFAGLSSAVLTLPSQYLVIQGVHLISRQFCEDISSDEDPSSFFTENLLMPVLEELIFRGIFQNSVAYLQNKMNQYAPEKLKDSHIVKWITSPSARILLVNSLFAAMHIFNTEDGYLSLAEAVASIATIFLFPTHSIQFETHGMIATITNHIAHNSLVDIFEYYL